MEVKGDNIYVNIKELPVVEQINSGDFLIVETDTGTNILDFENFIVLPDNTTFYGEIVLNATNIGTLSTSIQALSTSLIPSVSTSLLTTIRTASASNTALTTTTSATLYSAIAVASGAATTQLQTFSAAALLPYAWASFATDATVVHKSDTVSSVTTTPGSGIYQINFSPALPNVNYIVNAIPFTTGAAFISVGTKNVSFVTLSAYGITGALKACGMDVTVSI